jgi:uncharacterized protein (UPF0548 family)
MGSYSHSLSCKVMSASVPRGHGAGRSYLMMEAPRWVGWTPGSLPGQGKRGDERIGIEVLSALSNMGVGNH